MASDRERRRQERYHAKLFAELVSPVRRESLGRGVVLDVSLSGFSVETEADLDLDQELECHIEIPLSIRARVARRLSDGQLKKYGMKMIKQGFLDKFLVRKLLKGSRTTKKI